MDITEHLEKIIKEELNSLLSEFDRPESETPGASPKVRRQAAASGTKVRAKTKAKPKSTSCRDIEDIGERTKCYQRQRAARKKRVEKAPPKASSHGAIGLGSELADVGAHLTSKKLKGMGAAMKAKGAGAVVGDASRNIKGTVTRKQGEKRLVDLPGDIRDISTKGQPKATASASIISNLAAAIKKERNPKELKRLQAKYEDAVKKTLKDVDKLGKKSMVAALGADDFEEAKKELPKYMNIIRKEMTSFLKSMNKFIVGPGKQSAPRDKAKRPIPRVGNLEEAEMTVLSVIPTEEEKKKTKEQYMHILDLRQKFEEFLNMMFENDPRFIDKYGEPNNILKNLDTVEKKLDWIDRRLEQSRSIREIVNPDLGKLVASHRQIENLWNQITNKIEQNPEQFDYLTASVEKVVQDLTISLTRAQMRDAYDKMRLESKTLLKRAKGRGSKEYKQILKDQAVSLDNRLKKAKEVNREIGLPKKAVDDATFDKVWKAAPKDKREEIVKLLDIDMSKLPAAEETPTAAAEETPTAAAAGDAPKKVGKGGVFTGTSARGSKFLQMMPPSWTKPKIKSEQLMNNYKKVFNKATAARTTANADPENRGLERKATRLEAQRDKTLSRAERFQKAKAGLITKHNGRWGCGDNKETGCWPAGTMRNTLKFLRVDHTKKENIDILKTALKEKTNVSYLKQGSDYRWLLKGEYYDRFIGDHKATPGGAEPAAEEAETGTTPSENIKTVKNPGQHVTRRQVSSFYGNRKTKTYKYGSPEGKVDPITNKPGFERQGNLDDLVQELFGYSTYEEYRLDNEADLDRSRGTLRGAQTKRWSGIEGPTMHPIHVGFAAKEFMDAFNPEDYVGIIYTESEKSDPTLKKGKTEIYNTALENHEYRKKFFGDEAATDSIGKVGVLPYAMYEPREGLINKDIITKLINHYLIPALKNKENDILIANTEGDQVVILGGKSQVATGGTPLTIGKLKANAADPGQLVKSSTGFALRLNLKEGHVLIVPRKGSITGAEKILAQRVGAKI